MPLCLVQLFMCGMWLLLQCVVVLLYHDIPPLDSLPEHMALHQVRGQEEEPLMEPEDDGTATSDSVHSEPMETGVSGDTEPTRPSSPEQDPFENFSASRGEC